MFVKRKDTGLGVSYVGNTAFRRQPSKRKHAAHISGSTYCIEGWESCPKRNRILAEVKTECPSQGRRRPAMPGLSRSPEAQAPRRAPLRTLWSIRYTSNVDMFSCISEQVWASLKPQKGLEKPFFGGKETQVQETAAVRQVHMARKQWGQDAIRVQSGL